MAGKASPPAHRGRTTTPTTAQMNPARAADTGSLQPPRPDGKPTEADIRARAFALWEQAGRPESDGVEYWLRAEQELHNPR